MQLSSPPASQEKDGDAPKDSAISVVQLRGCVFSGLHLSMLFQLAPQAVKTLLREDKAADDDTVSCMEIFTDGSSLIPRAWPRMTASGGWGAHITAICDNQRSAVIGMFFGEGTVDIGHQFFCGADSVHIGACEFQAVFAAFVVVSRCHFGGQAWFF